MLDSSLTYSCSLPRYALYESDFLGKICVAEYCTKNSRGEVAHAHFTNCSTNAKRTIGDNSRRHEMCRKKTRTNGNSTDINQAA